MSLEGAQEDFPFCHHCLHAGWWARLGTGGFLQRRKWPERKANYLHLGVTSAVVYNVCSFIFIPSKRGSLSHYC